MKDCHSRRRVGFHVLLSGSLVFGAAYQALAEDPLAPLIDRPARSGDLLDPRTPLPLLPAMAAHQEANMRQHLESVQAIVAALAQPDFDAIAEAALTMGSSEESTRMCQHLGAAGPADFTARALAFHRSAEEIVAAAQAKERAGVLIALARTLDHCSGCHATYRQQIVGDDAWQPLSTQGARH